MQDLPQGTPVLHFAAPVRGPVALATGAAGLEKNDGLVGAGAAAGIAATVPHLAK